MFLLIYCNNDVSVGIDTSDLCYLANESKSCRFEKNTEKLRGYIYNTACNSTSDENSVKCLL